MSPAATMARAKMVAQILSEHGLHVSSPDDGDLDDVERERWDACVRIIKALEEDTPKRMILWRMDGHGREDHALYLGKLYIGEIMQLHHNKKWRAWFASDDEGSEVGQFATPFEARSAVESALLNALPCQIRLLVEASMAS